MTVTLPHRMQRPLLVIFALACSITSSLHAQDACVLLAGASVIAEDGTFLGKAENQYAAESIFNEYGSHGGKYAAESIWNEYGKYGGKFSAQSPFNPYSSTPPALVKSGRVIAYLSVNRSIRGAINPYALKSCEF